MDILKVQKRLNQLGYTPKLDEDGLSGPSTKKAIAWFQKQNSLDADGIVGPKTMAKLFPNDDAATTTSKSEYDLKPLPKTETLDKNLALAAMQIAISQFNVKEKTGKNDGPAVEEYLKSIGLGKGYSWCMAFVYWSYKTAAEKLGVKNPLIKTGGVLKQWNEVPKAWKIYDKPKVGDIFIMDFGKGQGHTGIVTKVNADGSVETIEGNANSYGSREGNQVGKLNRKNLKFFIRIA